MVVQNDEQFGAGSQTRYRITKLQYPKYLDYYNAVAAVTVTLPTGEVVEKHYMVSLYTRHEGTIMLEGKLIPFRWDGVIHSPIRIGHYS